MKTKALILLSLIAIFACGDPKVKDDLTGKWVYESIDITNTKPVLKASFTIKSAGTSYNITDIAVSINGTESNDFTGEVKSIVLGDKIGSLILKRSQQTITLFNCDNLLYQPACTIDSVWLEDSKTTKYYWQSLKAGN